MSGKEGELRHRALRSDADVVKVQFSPEVRKAFAELESAVRGSRHFDGDIMLNLQDYAKGEPLSVHGAITGMAHVARETMKHVHETGDENARRALDNLIVKLIGMNDKSKPISLAQSPGKGR
jgi:hypothetical protein